MSTQSLTLTQADLNAFAKISGDFNPIHIDPAYAATTAFALPVAHGMHLLSLSLGTLQRRRAGVDVSGFSLMFPNPTPVGTPVSVVIEDDDDGVVGVQVHRADGVVGLRGEISVAPARLAAPAGIAASGEAYTETRTFTPELVTMLADLTGETAQPGCVPMGLIAGAISKILGVDLPGRGTNYLKQRLALLDPAPLGEELTFQVRVNRVVDHKRLVYLTTTCWGPGRGLVATGEALVLAHGRLPTGHPTTSGGLT